MCKLHCLHFGFQKYLLDSLSIAYENDEWCHMWYILTLQHLFLSISFFFFSFSVSSTTCWGFEVTLTIIKINQQCCSMVPKFSFEEWVATVLFSNWCNWLGSTWEKFELPLTFTCFLELLAAEYLHETNILIFISHLWLFVL